MKTVLIVGGTSGLGLALAKKLNGEYKVIVTGRKNPKVDNIDFLECDLTQEGLPDKINALTAELPAISVLIYAAGYYQEGRITEISEEEIENMISVGGRGLIYFVREILKKQGDLEELITITSTSQWTPREKEPIYNFVKAGAGHLSNAFAEDSRVGKVLVVGPAGMNTPFWDGIERDDLDKMLDPDWVAEQIMELRKGSYKYKFTRILREPPRVEEVEER